MRRATLLIAALAGMSGLPVAGATARVDVRNAPFKAGIAPRCAKRTCPSLLTTYRGDRVAGGVRYAAVTYTVGPEPELRPPRLDGTALAPPRPGATRRYAGQRVAALRRRHGTVVLTLATDDPAGRRIRLRRSAHGPVSIRVVPSRRVSAVSMAFRSPGHEAFHGLGGRRESTDLRGEDVTSWVLDYRFPDASTGYYAPQTSMVSSRGYAALLTGDRIARWRLDSDLRHVWRVSRAGSSLRLHLLPGSPRRSIRALTARTGRQRVPPHWSLGPTLSRTFGILTDGGGVYRRKVAADVRRLTHRRLPVAAYAFEGWAGLPRAFVRRVIRRLAAHGIRTELYLRSFVADDVAGTEPPGSFATAVRRGYVATHADGRPFLIPSPFPGAQAAVVDFTDPGARRWWRRRVASLLDTGARGFMNDFGEQVLPAMHFHDGSTGVTMHNRYPVLQAEVTRAAVDAWERAHPGRRAFFYQRAGFSGHPGSPAYEDAEFPGDETVDWQQSTGLPSIVPDMLNRAVGGAPGFTTDIGGYAQFTPSRPVLPPTGRELFVRWSEAAALTPFFRVHNSGLDGVRMPWSYDRATLRAWIAMARLHRRAEPMIARLWRHFTRSGVPMTQPLWLADPAGGRTPRGDDEWLLGPDLLAAPVLRPGATSRPVRLPPGCWRRRGAGRRLAGGRTIRAAAPLGALPWYTRCGTRPLTG